MVRPLTRRVRELQPALRQRRVPDLLGDLSRWQPGHLHAVNLQVVSQPARDEIGVIPPFTDAVANAVRRSAAQERADDQSVAAVWLSANQGVSVQRRKPELLAGLDPVQVGDVGVELLDQIDSQEVVPTVTPES